MCCEDPPTPTTAKGTAADEGAAAVVQDPLGGAGTEGAADSASDEAEDQVEEKETLEKPKAFEKAATAEEVTVEPVEKVGKQGGTKKKGGKSLKTKGLKPPKVA